ncbi:hypothetical protein D6827_02025, partial [Candidatus Parcubacteria bacterium]
MFGFKKQNKQDRDKSTAKASKVDLDDVVIKVMPHDFANKEPIVESKVQHPAKPTPKAATQLPVKAASVKAVNADVKKKRKKILAPAVLAVGLIILTGTGVAAWFLLGGQGNNSEVEPVNIDKMISDVNQIQNEQKVTENKFENPQPGTDTDSDGLTDVEEKLYGTKVRNPDTDGDTFLDGNEVFHRYSPLGEAPATLLDTGAVTVFTSPDQTFNFTYPISWSVDYQTNDNGDVDIITIQTDSKAVFSLEVVALGDGQDFEAWYEDSGDPKLLFTGLKKTLTKEGYLAYIGRDDRVEYLLVDGKIYIFKYDLNTENSIE